MSLEPPSGYVIEKLNVTLHNRELFRCGVEALDAFLQQRARKDQESGISTTHVVVQVASKDIIGYVTLLPKDLQLTSLPAEAKIVTKYGSIPTLLIGRLAVDVNHQGKKLGEFLLKFALKKALEITDTMGCAAVLVDAKDDTSKRFYEKYGFKALVDRPLGLYIARGTVARLFPEAD